MTGDAAAPVVDVAVVGCGPTGAVLAALLGQLGHRVAVVEATAAVYHLPRAAHLDAEAMRILDAGGVADRIADSVRPIAGMHFVDAAGEPLLRFDVDGLPTEQGWAAGYWFHQPRLEHEVRRRLTELPTVTVHLGTQVVGLHQHDDAVTLDLAPAPQDPSWVYAGPAAMAAPARPTGPSAPDPAPTAATEPPPTAVRARWVVGCDGARSTVRKALGVTLDDLGLDQPWLVVDAIPRNTAGLPEVCQQICDPSRPATYVPMPDPMRRWEVMLLPGESTEEAESPEGVRRLLASHVDPDQLEVLRAVVYRFHALVAVRWRAGRTLLAGDAAHQMPPFLGQGMCSGLRDAANLAWRLDAVLGGAGDDLLDGYQAEREPHVRAIIGQVLQAGGFIQTTDPTMAAERDALLRAQGTGSFESARPPALSTGLVAPATPRAGSLSTQPALRSPDGSRRGIDRLAGSRWLLAGPAGDELAARATDLASLVGPGRLAVLAVAADGSEARLLDGAGAVEVTGTLEPARGDWMAELVIRGGVALVRPDRYVLGTADDLVGVDELVATMARALGSTSPAT